MNVIPIVAQEVVNRYHRERSNNNYTDTLPSNTAVNHHNTVEVMANTEHSDGRAAVTVELASLLTRLWLYDDKYSMDVERSIPASAAEIESLVESMVHFLSKECSVANLSLLSLQTQTHDVQCAIQRKQHIAKIKHEAITLRLVETILQKKINKRNNNNNNNNDNDDDDEHTTHWNRINKGGSDGGVDHHHHHEESVKKSNSQKPRSAGQMSDRVNHKALADELLGDITMYILHRYHQLHDEYSNNKQRTINNSNANTNSSSITGGVAKHNADDQINLSSHKATASVLCGILPRKQVISFMTESRVERQRQLEEFSKIVWGIRVYRVHHSDSENTSIDTNNSNSSSNYAGVANVRFVLSELIHRTQTEITTQLTAITDRVHRTLLVLELPTNGLTELEMQTLREEYHHLLQIRFNLLTLQWKHASVQHRVERFLLTKFNEVMQEIEQVLHGEERTAEYNGPQHGKSNSQSKIISSAEKANTTEREVHTLKVNTFNNSAVQHERYLGDLLPHHISSGVMATSNKTTSAVPKKIIYPMFMALSDAYEAAMHCCDEFDEMDALLSLNMNSSNAYESVLPLLKADEAIAQHQSQLQWVSKLRSSQQHFTQANNVNNKNNNYRNNSEPEKNNMTNFESECERAENAHAENNHMNDGNYSYNTESAEVANELQSLLVNAQNKLNQYHLSIHYTLHAPQTMNEHLAQYFAHSLFALNGCCPVTLFTKHLLVEGSVHVEGKCVPIHNNPVNSTNNIQLQKEYSKHELSSNNSSATVTTAAVNNLETQSQIGYLVLSGGSRFSRLSLSRPMYFAFCDAIALKTFLRRPEEFVLPFFLHNKWGEPGLLLLAGLDELLPHELYIAGARDVTLLDKVNDRNTMCDDDKTEQMDNEEKRHTTRVTGQVENTEENNNNNNSDEIVTAMVDATYDRTLDHEMNEMLNHAYHTDHKKQTDAFTQTGQIESYIDHNYRWNEWDLRRQALKLANLMQMKTRSAQTKESHYKQEIAIQVNERKEKSTQTMRDAAVQPSITVQYLKGLRGTTNSVITQVQQ